MGTLLIINEKIYDVFAQIVIVKQIHLKVKIKTVLEEIIGKKK